MSVCAVGLLCEKKPELPKPELLEALRARLPDVEPLDPRSDLCAFAFRDHRVTYQGGTRVPSQALLAVAERKADQQATLNAAVEQSWGFRGAAEAVARNPWSVIVTDVLADGLPRGERLWLFEEILDSAIQVVQPAALHWIVSQQIVPIETFRDRERPGDRGPDLQSGALNVRFWNVSNGGAGECLMDTVGLSVFGLPDLQCHYRRLDPQQVARVLYNTALYVFEKGDLIGDGHTVQGTEPSSRWRCQHEDALAKPARVVIDLDPGDPYAAGSRRR